jgi:hypothetical protein
MWDGDWNDTIGQGGVLAVAQEHKARGTMPAMLWQHDRFSKPAGGGVDGDPWTTRASLSRGSSR